MSSILVLDLEGAAIGDGIDRLNLKDGAGGPGGLRQQAHVDDLIGRFLLDDHFILRVDRDLDVAEAVTPPFWVRPKTARGDRRKRTQWRAGRRSPHQSEFRLVCLRRGGVAIGADLGGVAKIYPSTLFLRHLLDFRLVLASPRTTALLLNQSLVLLLRAMQRCATRRPSGAARDTPPNLSLISRAW